MEEDRKARRKGKKTKPLCGYVSKTGQRMIDRQTARKINRKKKKEMERKRKEMNKISDEGEAACCVG